jgi:hypothetical protein
VSARIAIVRHGPFASDPRVSREALALTQLAGAAVEVFVRGPEPDPWIHSPNLAVTTLGRRPPSDNPLLLAFQAMTFGLRARRRILGASPPFDAVVVHSIPSWLALLVSRTRRSRRPRLLLDHHEPEAEMLREAGIPGPVAALYARVERMAIRAVDGVVDVSPEMARRTAGLGARSQLVVDNSPRVWDRDGPILGGPFDLAVFGSLIERYDLATLRNALGRMSEGVAVFQAGRGRAALPDNPSGGPFHGVTYLPSPQLQEALRRCRFGFVGLRPSGFTDLVSPNRLWELAALGVPAIVAHTPLTSKLLGPFALYYRGGSARSLTGAIHDALAMTDGDRLRMGQGALDRLGPRLWEAQARPFVDFCLGRPASPAAFAI